MSLFHLFGLPSKGESVDFETEFEDRNSVSSQDGEDSDVEEHVLVTIRDDTRNSISFQAILYATAHQSLHDMREYRATVHGTYLVKSEMTDEQLLSLIKARLAKVGTAFAFQILRLFSAGSIVNFLLSTGLDVHSLLPSPVEGKSHFK